MLAAEAMRLAAIEVLCPTGSKATDLDWPTIARHRVYDSAGVIPEDLDQGAPFTPCLSVYTDEVKVARRGDVSNSTTGFPTAVLVVIAELAVASEGEDGEPLVAPLVENDARARLVLGALCAQVRKALNIAEPGTLFRYVVGSVDDFRIEPFSLPQFDIRWLRSTMRFTCLIKEDKYTDDGGMPEPMKSLFTALPPGSYAREKLAELNDAFTATTRTALQQIVFSTRGNPNTSPEGEVEFP